MTYSNLILTGAAVTTALMAGLFYAWTCSVTIGIARLPDAEYIAAFQAMNRAILNPLFFICFFGAALLLPYSTYLHYTAGGNRRFWLLLFATLAYLVGIVGVTIVGNVPLNESLDAFPLQSASPAEIAQRRLSFEGPWNGLNTVRTLAGTIAILLTTVACLQGEED